MAELECVVDADLALSCEVREQPDQRQRYDNQRGVGAASERSEDGNGSQGQSTAQIQTMTDFDPVVVETLAAAVSSTP